MIYKNGITVEKIEIIVDKEGSEISYHFHLSNKKVWSYKAESVNPSALHNQTKLETGTVLTLGRAMMKLKEEMEK